jgi:hypothetical protein
MAARITKYLNKYVCRGLCLIYHNGFTAGNFDLPDHGFLLLTWFTGPMESFTGNSYQAEALTNVFRYHTLFLEPSVSQKNAKNQCALLPGISVRVQLASHFTSVIGNFRSSGWLDLHIQWFFTSDFLHRSYGMIYGE